MIVLLFFRFFLDFLFGTGCSSSTNLGELSQLFSLGDSMPGVVTMSDKIWVYVIIFN